MLVSGSHSEIHCGHTPGAHRTDRHFFVLDPLSHCRTILHEALSQISVVSPKRPIATTTAQMIAAFVDFTVLMKRPPTKATFRSGTFSIGFFSLVARAGVRPYLVGAMSSAAALVRLSKDRPPAILHADPSAFGPLLQTLGQTNNYTGMLKNEYKSIRSTDA